MYNDKSISIHIRISIVFAVIGFTLIIGGLIKAF